MMKDLQEKPEGVENEAVEQVHYAVVRAEPALADCECFLPGGLCGSYHLEQVRSCR